MELGRDPRIIMDAGCHFIFAAYRHWPRSTAVRGPPAHLLVSIAKSPPSILTYVLPGFPNAPSFSVPSAYCCHALRYRVLWFSPRVAELVWSHSVESFGYRIGPALKTHDHHSDKLLLRLGVCVAIAANVLLGIHQAGNDNPQEVSAPFLRPR